MKDLSIIIVGAGIGGLQAALALSHDGHSVKVFESTIKFLEVGAGIRVPANASRLGLAWGINFDKISKCVSLGNRFVDWQGRNLLDCSFSDMEARYGAPYYFIHRADLINALVEAVQGRANVQLCMDTKVVDYDFDKPAVLTQSGWHEADLIICADGIKSSARTHISGKEIIPKDTGDVAYRILVPTEALLSDPETKHLVLEPWATHWIGPSAHAVGYPLRGGELYNIIIDVTHQTDLGQPIGLDEWRSEADNAQLMVRFEEWCKPVRKLCELTGAYLKWKLADFERLDRWVHPSGRAVLLGDSCHPMMPYMAQGAALATEDAATLAAVLRKGTSIREALEEYQTLRLPRTAYVAKNTRILQQWWHLEDGPERDRRDTLMHKDSPENPMFWGYSKRRDWLFGHDARQLQQVHGSNEVPELPPMPDPMASVYTKVDACRST